MNDMFEELRTFLRADERGEFRVLLPKATVFRLRQAALVESAKTSKRVTWLSLLERAADDLLNKNTKVVT
ncbi:MAG TPA: hypothetical protein VH092_18040 [Urbifossiella sp.]|jgi:hypothetical protein|nr:hypothetical protein [Urbifossiella sp.]